LSALAAVLFEGRKRWKARCLETQAECQQLQQQIDQALQEGARLQEALQERQQQIEQLQTQAQNNTPTPSSPLDDDAPLPHHQFGPCLISLSLQMTAQVGFRATRRILELLCSCFGWKLRIPTWQAIRSWAQRRGIDLVEHAPKLRHGSGCWIVDHSMQIGQEKFVLILRVQQLPPAGQALTFKDVEVLAVLPGTQWKKEDMARIYAEVAERFGTPRAVVCDGASELREGVEMADWPGKKRPIVLRDFKHQLANRFEKLLGKNDDFQRFNKHVQETRNQTQQTELASLTPPSQKQKARFMNLQPTIQWAQMAHWVVNCPEQQQRMGVRAERVQEKLGWINDFSQPITQWAACQDVISASVTWINENGLSRQAPEELATVLGPLMKCHLSKQLGKEALEFVREQVGLLSAGERLPGSTDIIESAFARFKSLEKQQSKGGLTMLLPVLATLLSEHTPESIAGSFERVGVQAVKDWQTKHLPRTLSSRRAELRHAFRAAHPKKPKNPKPRATKTPATT
jgi:hypothetical protein